MTYTPQHVANYFLDRAAEEGKRLSPMKLLKLVYIAYGWYIALKDQKLFAEPIEAWQHGPVIASIYHEFKHYGSSPIIRPSVTVDYSELEGNLTPEFTTPRIPSTDTEANIVLDTVWNSYKDFTAARLRDLTHQSDTPWAKVYEPDKRGVKLRDDHIREHYVDKIGRYIEASKPWEAEAV